MNFNELKLKKEIIDAINEVNYSSMTLIQENVLEKSINGIDILAQSPTGTGKTLCFVLPILNKVNFSTNSQIQAVIIVPTRELVLQIHSDFLKFGKNIKNLNIIQIYGGQKIFKQINHLKSMPQIAIFTPGRFVDHIKRKTIDLSNVSTLVLDEVDEMFDMGFKRDIEFIIGNINTKHQTIMITATLNNEVEIASKKFQSNPYKYIDINSQSRKVNNNIEQHFIRVNDKNKIGVLEKIIKDNNFFVAIIFVNTINTAKWLGNKIRELGFKAESIHGDLKQNIRERIMRNFHNGMYQIVVGTDVISRGIDVKNIDAVINYDFPREISSYVHRIGRTGRGDNKGASYTFMSDNIDSTVIALEKHIGSKLNELKFAEFEYIQNQDNHYNRRSSSNHRFNNNKNKYHNHWKNNKNDNHWKSDFRNRNKKNI